MSRRQSIAKALAEKIKDIDGSVNYKSNIFNNAYPYLKFWDQVNDFPCVYITTGTEMREYLPGDFTWGHLNIAIKLYTRGEDAQSELENLIEDVEKIIHDNRVLVYDETSGATTTEILVHSIVTDEGLLAPYGVGEVLITVQYALSPI